LLLEKRDLADLADKSEDEPLFSTTMALFMGETGATGTEAEIVAEAATALVEDIFISKKYWVWFLAKN
jgi:hypothetical protein